MNRFGIGCALSLVVACNNKPPEDEPEESGIYGILELDSPQTGEAEVEVFRAFSYIDDGKLIAFLSSNFSTTCDDAAAYLAPDFPVEKDSILRAGTCATTLFLPSYNGRSDEVGPATDVDPGESRSSVIECAMGGGVFELEDFDDGSGEDYTWSGKWFEGVPLQYDWLIEGTAGEEKSQPTSFEIVFKHRFNSQVRRDPLIDALAKLIGELKKSHGIDDGALVVDLTNPDFSIQVEIVQNICGMSIVPGGRSYRKFNLVELMEVGRKGQVAGGSSGAGGGNKEK